MRPCHVNNNALISVRMSATIGCEFADELQCPNDREVSCPNASVRPSDSEAVGHIIPEMSSAGMEARYGGASPCRHL